MIFAGSKSLKLIGSLSLLVAATCQAIANDRAIVIGVSKYQAFANDPPENDRNLKYADRDARLFKDTLVKQMGFAEKDVEVFTSVPQGGETLSSSKNIINAFKELPNVFRDPTRHRFVFYFSGHGLTVNKQSLLATTDFDPLKPLGTNNQEELSSERLNKRLSAIQADFTLCVFDMCRSGTVGGLEGSNNPFKATQIGAKTVANIYSVRKGYSYEDPNLQQGVFTYYFCNAIVPKRIGSEWIVNGMNDEGFVTLKGMESYVSKQVHLASARLKQNSTDQGVRSTELEGLPSFDTNSVSGNYKLNKVKYNRAKYRPPFSDLQKYDVYCSAGWNAYGEQNYKVAAIQFGFASEVTPFTNPRENALAAFAAGICYFQSSDLKSANTFYKKAIDIDRTYADAYNNLGVIANIQERFSDARNAFWAAITINPKYVNAIHNLAVLRETFYQDYTGAELLYRKAIEIDPNYANAMNNLGLLLQRHFPQKKREAKYWYEGAIKCNKALVPALNNLGSFFQNITFEYELANEEFEKAIEAESKYPKSTFRDFQPGDAAYNLAFLYQIKAVRLTDGRDHNFKRAIELYEKVIAEYPNHGMALNNLGRLLAERRGDFVRAEDLFHRATVALPYDQLVWGNYAVVLSKNKKLKEADLAQRMSNALVSWNKLRTMRPYFYSFSRLPLGI